MILFNNENPQGLSIGSYRPRLKWEWEALGYQMSDYKSPNNIYGREAKRGKERKKVDRK